MPSYVVPAKIQVRLMYFFHLHVQALQLHGMSNSEDEDTNVSRNVTVHQSTRHKMQILTLLGPEDGDAMLLRSVGNYHSSRRDTPKDLNLHEDRTQNFKPHTDFFYYRTINQALLDQRLPFLPNCYTSPLKILKQMQASCARPEVLTAVKIFMKIARRASNLILNFLTTEK